MSLLTATAPERKRLCPEKTSSHSRLLHPCLTESLRNVLHIRSVSFSYPKPSLNPLSHGKHAFTGRLCVILAWSRQFHWYEKEGGADIKGRDHNTYLPVCCLLISLFLPLDYENLEGRNYVLVSLYVTQNKCPIYFKNYLIMVLFNLATNNKYKQTK